MNEDVFKIWSPNMAWLLGYIYADGSVGQYGFYGYLRLRFGCKESDVELLQFIKEFLRAPQKIGCSTAFLKKTGKFYKSCSLTITSYELVKDLVELHGLKARKSYLNLPFPNVPDEFLPHFVRGYFDGDGSVYWHRQGRAIRFSLVGTDLFLAGIRDRMVSSLDLPKHSLCQATNSRLVSKLGWYRGVDIQKIYRWFYKDRAAMYLKRKEEKMRRVFEPRPKRKVGSGGCRKRGWKIEL